ncbi:MAG: hypothetical protein JF598_19190 [Streptomyces sp.]|nr:hypothetical protein [Streptomyces sp.]
MRGVGFLDRAGFGVLGSHRFRSDRFRRDRFLDGDSLGLGHCFLGDRRGVVANRRSRRLHDRRGLSGVDRVRQFDRVLRGIDAGPIAHRLLGVGAGIRDRLGHGVVGQDLFRGQLRTSRSELNTVWQGALWRQLSLAPVGLNSVSPETVGQDLTLRLGDRSLHRLRRVPGLRARFGIRHQGLGSLVRRGLRLGSEVGHRGLGGVHRLLGRNNRFGSRGHRVHRRLDGGLGRGAPRDGTLRLRGVVVLGGGHGRGRLPYRCARGTTVGEGADRARGGVGDRRTEVQRPAGRDGRDRHRGSLRLGRADGAQIMRSAVAAGHLVRARLVDGLDDGLRGGRGDLVAPRALGARQQQQVFVLGGGLGEVGVRTRDARLFHHACVLRQSLARDLAGVGHAYPSPIG